jgi:hypothetical protein
MSPHELNMALARALNVENVNDVYSIVLTIEAGEMPKMKITRAIKDAEKLRIAVEVLGLHASKIEGGGYPPAKGSTP